VRVYVSRGGKEKKGKDCSIAPQCIYLLVLSSSAASFSLLFLLVEVNVTGGGRCPLCLSRVDKWSLALRIGTIYASIAWSTGQGCRRTQVELTWLVALLAELGHERAAIITREYLYPAVTSIDDEQETSMMVECNASWIGELAVSLAMLLGADRELDSSISIKSIVSHLSTQSTKISSTSGFVRPLLRVAMLPTARPLVTSSSSSCNPVLAPRSSRLLWVPRVACGLVGLSLLRHATSTDAQSTMESSECETQQSNTPLSFSDMMNDAWRETKRVYRSQLGAAGGGNLSIVYPMLGAYLAVYLASHTYVCRHCRLHQRQQLFARDTDVSVSAQDTMGRLCDSPFHDLGGVAVCEDASHTADVDLWAPLACTPGLQLDRIGKPQISLSLSLSQVVWFQPELRRPFALWTSKRSTA